MEKRINKQELIELIESLKISKDEYWILSSSALVLRGIYPDVGDLDIAVTEKGLQELKENYHLRQLSNGWFMISDKIECILDTKEDWKIDKVDGYNLESIQKYYNYLVNSDREKDKQSIPLVEKYMKELLIIDNLKIYSTDEIVELIKAGKVSAANLTDSGICPTCFDKENNRILYGDNKDKLLYEDEDVECFLVGNPRANGHVAISTKKHYKDMMELDDEICQKVFLISKKVMCILKEVYGSESVYLCTMCDGPMNHFHVQLIPRYSFEKRGSKNFVKSRFEYVDDSPKIKEMRKRLEIK